MKKILTILLCFCLVSCSSIKKRNDEKKQISNITIYDVYPNQNDFYVFKLGYGTGEFFGTVKIPVYYTYLASGYTDKDDEYTYMYADDGEISAKNAVDELLISEDEVFCDLSFASSINGNVSITFEVFDYGIDVDANNFEELKKSFSSDYEVLDGVPYETILLSGDSVTVEDFIIYINVCDETCISVEYDGDDSVSRKEMALKIFDVMSLN